MEARIDIIDVPGFTLNMFKNPVAAIPDEANKEYVRFHNAKTRKFIESNYDSGYVFGAYASVGVTNLYPYKGGMVVFFVADKDTSKLVECLEREFLVSPKVYRRSETRYTVNVHSAAFARTLEQFGKGEERTIPNQFLVNNEKYLRGIRDGLLDFEGYKPDERKVVNLNRAFNPRNLKILQLIEKHLDIDSR